MVKKMFIYRAYNPLNGKKKMFKAENIENARARAKKVLKTKGIVRCYRVTKKYQ